MPMVRVSNGGTKPNVIVTFDELGAWTIVDNTSDTVVRAAIGSPSTVTLSNGKTITVYGPYRSGSAVIADVSIATSGTLNLYTHSGRGGTTPTTNTVTCGSSGGTIRTPNNDVYGVIFTVQF